MAKFATYAGGAIWWPILQLLQVAPSSGQICNICKWCHLVAKFAINASGAIWWPNLQLIQVVPSGEITQVLDAIPWVRCASGNVFLKLFKRGGGIKPMFKKTADLVTGGTP